MCLGAVLKPVSGFEANTEGLDTQLFKKVTHACTRSNCLHDINLNLNLLD